jgi:hypothetical protein
MIVGKIKQGIRVSKTISYDVPEGLFSAVCLEVDPFDNHGTLCWRIRFEITDPRLRNKRFIVARTFFASLESGSLLRSMITEWLGEEFLLEFEDSELKPEHLIGKAADIDVKHIYKPSYPKPFCELTGVFPPRSMQVTQMAA